MKITSSSKVCKVAYHNSSYLVSLGKRKLYSFGV